MDIVVLNMVLDSENLPDFGDITINKDGDIVLLHEDISLLLNNLTRSVCGDAFNIQVGQKAKIIDTGAVFVYHSNDRWYLSECEKFHFKEWQNIDDVCAGHIELRLMKDGEAYCLEDDEEIVCDVKQKSDDTVVFSKTIQRNRYHGGGYYSCRLTREEADIIRPSSDYYVDFTVLKDQQDVTASFTISDVYLGNWIYE